MRSIFATLRVLPLSLLLVTAVSAVPGRKCGPASSASSITSTVVSTTEDLSTATSSPESTVPVVSTSEDLTIEPSSPTSTLSTPTLTQAPDLTTITSCPPTPTYNGSPSACFVSGGLFAECKSLTGTAGGRALNGYVADCSYSLKSYATLLAPAATSCWPAYVANSVAASSVYACLVAPTASLICSYDSNCATNTYTVGQEPTPVPTIGVNLLPDPSFESGTLGKWVVTEALGSAIQISVSSAMPKTGDYSVAMHADNTNGYADYITISNIPVVPGATYQFTYSSLQTNPAALTTFVAYAFPQGATNMNYNTPTTPPANQWQAGTLTFTAATSWVNLAFWVAGNRLGTVGSAQGINDIYLDDVSFVRLS